MFTSVVVPFWFIMKSVMQECLQAIKELMSTANNYGIEKYRHGHPKLEFPRNMLLMKNLQFLSNFAQTFTD